MRCFVLVVGVVSASNVVYIVTDDQDQMLGSSFPDFGSTPLPKTKELFADGVMFTNFFIHVPICNPSRSTTLTGRYFHNLKTTNTSWAAMHVDMNLVHNSSFAVGFKEAGYSTALFGKYANAMPDYKPKGWDVFMANDGGSYLHPHFTGEAPEGEYTTSVVGNATVDWISRQTHKKFFAYVAPKAAHEPFNPAPWYASYWDPSWPQFERRGPAWNCSFENRRDHGSNVPSQPPLTDYSSQVIAGIWRNRWRTLMSVDDLVEGVVRSAPEDTYFFFTSDHGFQLGQFDMLMDKRHVYDWDTRVHLLVRGPGLSSRIDGRLFTNVDLAPTFAQIAGFVPHHRYDGISLFSVRERQSIFIEYYYNDPNVKCIENCSEVATRKKYPTSDSSCADLENHSLCWGRGCNEGCYPTEDERNNFIGLRLINDTHNLLYAKYQTGQQSKMNIDFRQEEALFYELFDANQDPWMINNLHNVTSRHQLADLDAQLMDWFDCSGASCA